MKSLHLLTPLFTLPSLATDLLLPLYQYPASSGAVWSPITDALAANPSLTAKIIINPNNGPGTGIDDPQYVAGTQLLAAHANAQLIGYVHTSTDGGATRCSVPWESVAADIRTWSSWVDKGVPITGIFIDEAPANSNNDCVAYMRNLTDFIRTDAALKFAKRLVVFNPGGTGALQPYYDMKPDLIVALETCFTVPEKAQVLYDQCDPQFVYERYDHDGVGSSIDNVVFPNIGQGNAGATAVLVHGFHDFNGASANFSATEAVLSEMIQGVVARGIAATFFNTAGYHEFEDGPASIGAVARLLSAANGV